MFDVLILFRVWLKGPSQVILIRRFGWFRAREQLAINSNPSGMCGHDFCHAGSVSLQSCWLEVGAGFRWWRSKQVSAWKWQVTETTGSQKKKITNGGYGPSHRKALEITRSICKAGRDPSAVWSLEITRSTCRAVRDPSAICRLPEVHAEQSEIQVPSADCRKYKQSSQRSKCHLQTTGSTCRAVRDASAISELPGAVRDPSAICRLPEVHAEQSEMQVPSADYRKYKQSSQRSKCHLQTTRSACRAVREPSAICRLPEVHAEQSEMQVPSRNYQEQSEIQVPSADYQKYMQSSQRCKCHLQTTGSTSRAVRDPSAICRLPEVHAEQSENQVPSADYRKYMQSSQRFKCHLGTTRSTCRAVRDPSAICRLPEVQAEQSAMQVPICRLPKVHAEQSEMQVPWDYQMSVQGNQSAVWRLPEVRAEQSAMQVLSKGGWLCKSPAASGAVYANVIAWAPTGIPWHVCVKSGQGLATCIYSQLAEAMSIPAFCWHFCHLSFVAVLSSLEESAASPQ